MGTKWEVWAYVHDAVQGYHYEQVWGGQSLSGALRAFRQAKHSGAGCIRIEWRG